MWFSDTLLLTAFWIVATSSVIEWTREEFDPGSMPKTKSLARLRRVQNSESIGLTIRVPSGGGMTSDFCRRSVDCKGDRECFEFGTIDDNICDGEADCGCRPKDYKDCSWNADCEPGEVCPRSMGFSTSCQSESRADDLDLPPHRDGFTMDECFATDDCQPPRSCMLRVNGNIQDCAGGGGCRCLPRQPQACTAHRNCPHGELCATNRENGKSLCLSEAYVSKSSELVPVPRRLTFDPCATGKDCENPRKCKIRNDENEWRFCMSRSGCVCKPEELQECRQSRDCVNGEVCVRVTDRRDSPTICVSQLHASQSDQLTVADEGANLPSASADDGADLSSASPTNATTSKPSLEQAEESEVCIDARALLSFDKQDLLYPTHRMATTLCDQFESCATPGHIVLFKGKPMMMKSYCRRTLCTKRVMLVNSPKYRKGILVHSNSVELKFTPFAARYETLVEEISISWFVRLGM
eukprot:TRINITY_DN444_c8_g1_i1.p1 TRINITY_DN444_c8_g1~~TRINITY_DN444_c8_g1_i1.p1  ORF type:complete len:468 (-),score=28.44 TRINITY_DN444_c8_g1_i1:289-1692(-)